MIFLGIDLGWERKPSGLAALTDASGSLRLLDVARPDDPDAILPWVQQVAGSADAIVGVDAPLVIANPTGMRACDRLMHHHYGHYHAGAYPANLGRPFAAYTTGFSRQLQAMGFRHAAALGPRQPGRWQFEAFPHASYVQLFGLDRIIKYKKGPVAGRVRELTRLRSLMLERLPRLQPRLRVTDAALPAIAVGGAALKSAEDRLDAILCAYVAAWYWHWGLSRTDVHGSEEGGYIVVPQRLTS